MWNYIQWHIKRNEHPPFKGIPKSLNVALLYVRISTKDGDFMATLYDRIKSRRIELGLTVEELSHKMGYKDKSSISKIENGKADIPQSKIAAFADALETTPAYLMGWNETDEIELSPEEIELIKKYRKTSKKNKNTILTLLEDD